MLPNNTNTIYSIEPAEFDGQLRDTCHPGLVLLNVFQQVKIICYKHLVVCNLIQMNHDDGLVTIGFPFVQIC